MIGKLDRRVTIIQSITETGTSNEKKITGWEDIDDNPDVWAQKIERSGNTQVVDDRISFTTQTDWIVRYRTDLKVSPSMRLVYEMQVYEIVNIQEITGEARKRYTKLNTVLLDNIFYT